MTGATGGHSATGPHSATGGHGGAGRALAPARVVPLAVLGSSGGRRLLERNLRVQRRQWWLILSGFVEPPLYLLSIGLGIGHLVGRLPGPGSTTVSYAAFAAPALLATSAMNGAVTEATFNFFYKLRFAKIYDSVLTTPLGAGDVAAGEIASALVRGTIYSAAFLGFMAALGEIRSPWGLLALPAAMLIGLAFAASGTAVTTWMRGWSDFDLVQLALLPMFLFSTTFYPLGTFPRWLQLVVEATPLYHGVALCRGLCLGEIGWGLLGHAAYLMVLGAAGAAVTSRRIGKLLLR